MTTEEVFKMNQTISDRLAKMSMHDTNETARSAIAGEVRDLVTQLCLAIVEGNNARKMLAPKATTAPVEKELSVMDFGGRS